MPGAAYATYVVLTTVSRQRIVLEILTGFPFAAILLITHKGFSASSWLEIQATGETNTIGISNFKQAKGRMGIEILLSGNLDFSSSNRVTLTRRFSLSRRSF
jgi:hypothetical protein